MSFLTPYWRWEETGPYYGMPWSNLVGWFVTGSALMAVLEVVDRPGAVRSLPVGWMAAYYGLLVSLPLGMLAVAGAWGAVLTTISAAAATGACAGMLRAVLRASDALDARGVEEAPSALGVS